MPDQSATLVSATITIEDRVESRPASVKRCLNACPPAKKGIAGITTSERKLVPLSVFVPLMPEWHDRFGESVLIFGYNYH